MRIRLLLAASIAVSVVAVAPARPVAGETAAERAVSAAQDDPAKLPAAAKEVEAAIAAEPKAVKPRVLKARLMLIEARAKKTAERPPAFKAVLGALSEAEILDRWDAEPLQFRVDVLQAMGNPDHALLTETLRGIAIRLPADAAARRVYERQAGEVPVLREGDPMPRVQWRDSKNEPVAATSLWAKGPVIVELYRSAVWCPFCQRQLFALHDAADAFAAEGIAIVACSPDTPATIADIEANGLEGKKPFRLRLLSDPKGETADALGFLNPDTVKTGVRPEAFGLPYPTTIIVDNRGTVRFVKTHRDYRERVKPEEMIAIAQRIRVETTSAK
jgi:peroxiredoxin